MQSLLFLVNNRVGEGVKLTKCNPDEWMKNAILQVTYFLNGPMISLPFYSHIISYWEKVTSYDKYSHSITLEVQIGKF